MWRGLLTTVPSRGRSRTISTATSRCAWRTSSSPTRRLSIATAARSSCSRRGRVCRRPALLLRAPHDVEIGFLQLIFLRDARRVGERAEPGSRLAILHPVGGGETQLQVLGESSCRHGRKQQSDN